METDIDEPIQVTLPDIAPYFRDQLANPNAKSFFMEKISVLNPFAEKLQQVWESCTPVSLFYGFKSVDFNIKTYLKNCRNHNFIKKIEHEVNQLVPFQGRIIQSSSSSSESETLEEEEEEDNGEEIDENDLILQPLVRESSTWTDEETDVLQRLFTNGATIYELSQFCGRSEDSIRIKFKERDIDTSNTEKPNISYIPREWTHDKNIILKKAYDAGKTAVQISRIFGKSTEAIRSQIKKLQAVGYLPRRANATVWSEDEIAVLKHEFRNGKNPREIAALCGRPIKSITSKIHVLQFRGQLHLKRVAGPAWTDEEIEQLKVEFNSGKTAPEIAEIFGRKLETIRNQIYKLQLQGELKKRIVLSRWTPGEVEKLIAAYNSGSTTKEIAQLLGRTMGSVAERICILQEMGKIQHKVKTTNWLPENITSDSRSEKPTDAETEPEPEADPEIEKLLTNNKRALNGQIKKLQKEGVIHKKEGRELWRSESIEILKEEYEKGKSAKEIAVILGRPTDSIHFQITKLQQRGDLIQKRPIIRWTSEDRDTLISEYNSGKPLDQIAQLLGRTPQAIQTRILKLQAEGLITSRSPYNRWSSQESELLLAEYNSGKSTMEICATLGRSKDSVQKRIRKLKLRGIIPRKYDPLRF